MTKLKREKVKKIRIIPKAHAHFQTMTKASVKFLKDGLTINCKESCVHKALTPTIRGRNHALRSYRKPHTTYLYFTRKGKGQ